VEKYGTATIRHTRIACYITEATDTHSEYVILIVFHGKMVRRRPFTVMFLRALLSCLLIPLTWWHTPVSRCIWISKFRGNRMDLSSSVEMREKNNVSASTRKFCKRLTSDVTSYSRKTESLTTPPRKTKNWLNIFLLKSILRLKYKKLKKNW
jgi:hypothetical protein